MLAWLMLRPKILAGLGVVAVIASMWAAWQWEVRGLKKDLVRSAEALKMEQDVSADLRVRLKTVIDQEEKTRTKLRAEIEAQNAAIVAIQTAAKTHEQAAVIAAIRKLEEGRAKADAFRSPTTTIKPGHEGMNAALKAIFGEL